MIELTQAPIDFHALTESVRDNSAGAVVLFLGTVREFTKGVQTDWLEYEAYPEMARMSLAQLEDEVREKFTVVNVAISHRFGTLQLGDVSVAIAVSSPHRAQAFEAGRWLIDTLKERVPIWKKEHYSDGREEWQHPGMPTVISAVEKNSPSSASGENTVHNNSDNSSSERSESPPIMTTTASTSRRLIDSFGRLHNNLRISVTDRCNIRCFYCMPAENVEFMPKEHLLSFEEIERVVRIGTTLGIDRVRLTGGEPLVRRDLHVLVEKLAAVPGIVDIGLTTNGILLEEQAQSLRDAGLRRLNISLDALDPEVFRKVTRQDGYERVLAGIEAARAVGFSPIKLNAVSVRGLTEDQIVPFGQLARETDTVVRFIEFMPLDADSQWQRDKVLFAHEIIATLEAAFGPLKPVDAPTSGGFVGHAGPSDSDSSRTTAAESPSSLLPVIATTTHAPAQDFEFADGRGRIGLIASISQPFCQSCNRFRLTADGRLRNCLFSHDETDIKHLLRDSGDDESIAQAMLASIAAKKEGHEINTARFIQPDRPMYSIGG